MCALINAKLLGIALIIIGLTYIDINVIETIIYWFKKTFKKNYDPNEGWIDIKENDKSKKK